MKKAAIRGILCLMIVCLAAGCSNPQKAEEESRTESVQESGKEEAPFEEETQEPPSSEEASFEYRERKEDSWFSEEELRTGGNLVEEYYTERGKVLICVSYDQEESSFLSAYGQYTPEYGDGNVLVLEVQLKGESSPLAVVLVRQSPENPWEIKEEKS